MYDEYLSKALSDLIVARQAIDTYKTNTKLKDMKNMASYHVQQAIEKVLKYSIYNSQSQNGNKIQELYTHNLDLLIKNYCVKYGITVPKKIVKNAKEYTRWEAESRYSLNYSIRIDSIVSAMIETEDWLVSLKPSYKSNVAHFRSKYKV